MDALAEIVIVVVGGLTFAIVRLVSRHRATRLTPKPVKINSDRRR